MRFLLDEDVDAGLVGFFIGEGHQAWTVPAANLSSVNDETVAVIVAVFERYDDIWCEVSHEGFDFKITWD